MPSRPDMPAGLCSRCRHARVVATPRSEFLLCERSKHDPAFVRYPRLPVLACSGFEPRGQSETPAGGHPDRGSQG